MSDATPDRERQFGAAGWVSFLLILIVAGYTAAYVYSPLVVTHGRGVKRDDQKREYPSITIARLFVPAGWLHAKIMRNRVQIKARSRSIDFSYIGEP